MAELWLACGPALTYTAVSALIRPWRLHVPCVTAVALPRSSPTVTVVVILSTALASAAGAPHLLVAVHLLLVLLTPLRIHHILSRHAHLLLHHHVLLHRGIHLVISAALAASGHQSWSIYGLNSHLPPWNNTLKSDLVLEFSIKARAQERY